MDNVVFQAAVTAVMAALVAQISTNGSNGTGNGTNNSSQVRPRECSYKYFANCKPKPFNGSGGVITLTRWFEKTESMFEICACPKEGKVKFVACTFIDGALSW